MGRMNLPALFYGTFGVGFKNFFKTTLRPFALRERLPHPISFKVVQFCAPECLCRWNDEATDDAAPLL